MATEGSKARSCHAWVAILAITAAGFAGPIAANDEPNPGVESNGKGKQTYAYPAPIPLEALDRMPDDATAYCSDGSWSSAPERKDACTDHHGVKVWFGPAPKGATGRCRDGTYNLVGGAKATLEAYLRQDAANPRGNRNM